MRSWGIQHALRAFTSAGAVVALSLVFHLLAGGHVPDLQSLAVLTLLVTAVTGPLTLRKVRLPGLLLVLGGTQVALHVAFETHPGHAGTHGSGSAVLMAAMHAGATLLTALLISQGGAALQRAWAWWAVRLLVLGAHRPVAAHPPLPVPVHRAASAPAPGVDAVMGRAPPVLV